MQELTEAEVHFLDAVLVHHPGRIGCPAEGRDWVHETAARLVEGGWVDPRKGRSSARARTGSPIGFSEKMVATFRGRVEEVRERASNAARDN